MRIGMRVAGLSMLALLFLAAGCGSGTPAAPSATAVPTALNGNWLLTGTLPFIDPLQLGVPQSFGLATTLTVAGNQIEGGVTQNFSCGLFFVGGSNVAKGSIAADGTFSASSTLPVPNPGVVPSLQLTGKAPAADGTNWTGTYTFATNNASCPGTTSGTFTASRIADVTGVYASTVPVVLQSSAFGINGQAVTPTFTLQQGGTLPGSTAFVPELLTGSIQIQGSPTLTGGATVAGMPSSGVLGADFVLTFTLNDGSRMNVLGQIEDLGSTKLVLRSIAIIGGSNGTAVAAPFEVVRR